MRIGNGRQQLNGSLMSNTSLKRAIGFSMVVLAGLPLSTDCSSEWEAKWGRQLSWLSSTLSLICIMVHHEMFLTALA